MFAVEALNPYSVRDIKIRLIAFGKRSTSFQKDLQLNIFSEKYFDKFFHVLCCTLPQLGKVEIK